MISVCTVYDGVAMDAQDWLDRVFIDPAVMELRPDYTAVIIVAEALRPGPSHDAPDTPLATADAQARKARAGGRSAAGVRRAPAVRHVAGGGGRRAVGGAGPGGGGGPAPPGARGRRGTGRQGARWAAGPRPARGRRGHHARPPRRHLPGLEL